MTYPYRLAVGFDDIVGTWVHTRLNGHWSSGRGTTIGILNDAGKIVVGWTYSDFNGANCVIDVVADVDGWCTPEALYMLFAYPFDQLGCKRVTSPVAATNTHCIKFVEWLGATHEATLTDACKTGDVLIYRLFKQDCRWLQKPDVLPQVIYNNG